MMCVHVVILVKILPKFSNLNLVVNTKFTGTKFRSAAPGSEFPLRKLSNSDPRRFSTAVPMFRYRPPTKSAVRYSARIVRSQRRPNWLVQ